MMNNFIIRCARNIPLCWRAWNINLHSGQSILNHQAKSLLFSPKIFQLSGRGSRSRPTRDAMMYSDSFFKFKQKLKRKGDFEMTFSEWETLREKILKESHWVENVLDATLMKSLIGKPDLSLSYLTYIKSKREPNMSTLNYFFQNCAHKYEDMVLEEFEKCKETYGSSKVFQDMVGPTIALTREWLQVKNWVFSAKYVDFGVSSALLKMSLKQQDYLTFYEIWTKITEISSVKRLSDIRNRLFVFWEEGVIPTDLFLELLKLGEFPLTDMETHKLKNYCESEWKQCESAVLTEVLPQSRICKSCKETLPEIEPLDKSIMKEMVKKTMKKLLIGENIFRKTTPKELDRFSDFMNMEGPFDYIIDGLNLMNIVSPISSSGSKKEKIKDLVDYYFKGKRVLVVTKEFDDSMKLIEGPIFRVNKKSSDDIYIMLAAFMSGPECYVLTNDDFGDHISLIDKELKPFFESWRKQRRIFFKPPDKFYFPERYKFTTTETKMGWHVPCRENDEQMMIYKYLQNRSKHFVQMQSKKFLCLSKKTSYVPSSELVLFRQVTNEWNKMKV